MLEKIGNICYNKDRSCKMKTVMRSFDSRRFSCFAGIEEVSQKERQGKKPMFEKGGFIVYGTTGVCEIEDITSPDMKGVSENRLYYVLNPCFKKGNRIFTPVDNEKVVIRAVMTQEEAASLVDEIPDIEELWEEDDKVREMRYKEAIRSCNPREWIQIIKTSYLRQQQRKAIGKKATTVDERYFKAAEEHLYAELSIALGVPKDEVKDYIQTRLGTK